jgi:inner membrane protein
VDNLTHSLVGLAAAKAGLERQSPYAAFVCVAAANLPDVDIVALAGGPAFYLKHHRGITHSIVGTLALAVALALLFCAAERAWARARGREPRARLKGLLVCSLLLAASHPLLDWTNSYGVRPLLPWDGRWIYGDLLFVIDPWVWLVLGGACFLLAESRARAAGWCLLALVATLLFFRVVLQSNAGFPNGPGVPPVALVLWCAGLAASALLRWKGVGARPGRVVAGSALLFCVFYCFVLALMHTYARTEAQLAASSLAYRTNERVLRVAATPVLADPFTWRCLSENERSTSRFDMGLFHSRPEELRSVARYERPAGEDEGLVRRASEGEAARVLLDFARFPVASVRRSERAGWVVQFADLRFTEPGAGARAGGFALDVPVGTPAGR